MSSFTSPSWLPPCSFPLHSLSNLAWCLARISHQPTDSTLIPSLLESATHIITSASAASLAAAATSEARSLSGLAYAAARVRYGTVHVGVNKALGG